MNLARKIEEAMASKLKKRLFLFTKKKKYQYFAQRKISNQQVWTRKAFKKCLILVLYILVVVY